MNELEKEIQNRLHSNEWDEQIANIVSLKVQNKKKKNYAVMALAASILLSTSTAFFLDMTESQLNQDILAKYNTLFNIPAIDNLDSEALTFLDL